MKTGPQVFCVLLCNFYLGLFHSNVVGSFDTKNPLHIKYSERIFFPFHKCISMLIPPVHSDFCSNVTLLEQPSVTNISVPTHHHPRRCPRHDPPPIPYSRFFIFSYYVPPSEVQLYF